MKVLWISNVLFPDVCKELGISAPVIAGWMHSGAKALLNENETIELAVATLYKGKKLKSMHLNGIYYFLIPIVGQNKEYEPGLEPYWKSVQNQFEPDVVHIHGTEYPHGLAYIRACGNKNVVISIQGLVSVYERYYYGGISRLSLLRNITFRDIVRLDSIFKQHADMYRRGLLETKTIQSINHIIGRTSWDKAHAWAANPIINYHFCNETLRREFYQHKWELEKCEKHSIFLSQAYYPLKGLQQMVNALPIILRHYPDTKVYVAGENFFTNRGLRLHGFGKYIRVLMKKKEVKDNIIFTGVLTEKEICNFYLKSHLFVCPSAIENSSNSIGEAQLLGVPCIASYVGGVSDLIKDNETGMLYRFEEIEMLADAVCKVFSNDDFADKLSKNEKKAALVRHDSRLNAQQLSSIYKKIVED
jgi:glycosyltransferase involved in cell wall biosynthesis